MVMTFLKKVTEKQWRHFMEGSQDKILSDVSLEWFEYKLSLVMDQEDRLEKHILKAIREFTPFYTQIVIVVAYP